MEPDTSTRNTWQTDPYWRVWGALYVASWGSRKMLWLLAFLVVFQFFMFFYPNQYSPLINRGLIASAVFFGIAAPVLAYLYLRHLNASDINAFVTGKLAPRAQVALPKWTSRLTSLTLVSFALIAYSIFALIQMGLSSQTSDLANTSLAWISGFIFGPGLYVMYIVGLTARYRIFHLPGIDKDSLNAFLNKASITQPKLKP